MDAGLLVSILGLAGSAVGSLCGVLINTKLSNYRIEQLEKRSTNTTISSNAFMNLSRRALSSIKGKR